MSICHHGFNSDTSHCAKCNNIILQSDRTRLQTALDDVRSDIADLYAMRGEDEYTSHVCSKVLARIDRGL